MHSIIEFLGGESKTIAFTIFSALIAFVAKVLHDLWAARRKDRLERINTQLKVLYGPLYAMDKASELAWQAFRQRTRPQKRFFDPHDPPSENDLMQWRLWMTTVFRPLHNQMHELIVQHADLLIEDDFPKSFAVFSAHIAAYRAVFRQWEEKDFSQHLSVVPYPRQEFTTYLEISYKRLKHEQRNLIGELPIPFLIL